MTSNQKENEQYTHEFDHVQRSEAEWIKQRREALSQDIDKPTVGIALSGGGIRSATFNLGILQGLSKKKLLPQVDMISSVSGGGYIASCFNWIRNHVKADSYDEFTDTPVDKGRGNGKEETVLDWLRGHGNYLIAGKGFSYWQLIASIIAGTLLNLIVLIPLFLWIIFAASADWLVAVDWPSSLHFSEEKPMGKHDGFLLFLILGHISLALYLVTVIAFAFTGMFPAFKKLTQKYFFRRNMGKLLSFGVLSILIGILPLFAGIEHWIRANYQKETLASMSQHLTYIIPLLSGALTLFKSKPKDNNGQGSSALATLGLMLLMYGFFVILYHIVNHTDFTQTTLFYAWSGLSLILAFTADVNAISMHSYYRGRLALAYMPEIKNEEGETQGVDSAMDFELKSMSPKYGGPLPVINTTMNTISSKKQKLRSRDGENFFLTPLYCGSTSTGYLNTRVFKKGEMALSTAFSVSGAAVDPNTYATNSRPVAFLMALLNFRLGYWTDNPNPKYASKRGRSASWYRLMLREMFGKGLDETSPQIHLSDGGHFENLGLYELLRRRCRYIIAGDASADLNNTLSGLGQAIQRARADFGVEVDIDVSTYSKDDELTGCASRLGKIKYSDGSEGQILYIKSQIQEKLSADVYAYWRENGTFPDQSTADQFFDEWQFDSYRELGKQISESVIGDSDTIEALFERLSTQEKV